jgi:phosphatidylglycerophosphatase A
MIKKLNILILTMLGIGKSKYAPGTVASFTTLLIFILFYVYKINISFLVLVTILIFTYSVFSIDRYQNYFEEIDSKEIVIDELIGQSIPILTIYSFIPKDSIGSFMLYGLISFLLFRFFDIAKPYPINKIDKNMKNGFGVMLDDVVAGVYSSIVLLIIILYIQDA